MTFRDLCTALAWDDFDKNPETLSAKITLHDTFVISKCMPRLNSMPKYLVIKFARLSLLLEDTTSQLVSFIKGMLRSLVWSR